MPGGEHSWKSTVYKAGAFSLLLDELCRQMMKGFAARGGKRLRCHTRLGRTFPISWGWPEVTWNGGKMGVMLLLHGAHCQTWPWPQRFS